MEIKGELVYYQKRHPKPGEVIEMVIYRVPESPRYPDCVRYRLFYVKGEQTVVGYDNHHPKGHHRHSKGAELSYEFESVEELISDFLAEVEKELKE